LIDNDDDDADNKSIFENLVVLIDFKKKRTYN